MAISSRIVWIPLFSPCNRFHVVNKTVKCPCVLSLAAADMEQHFVRDEKALKPGAVSSREPRWETKSPESLIDPYRFEDRAIPAMHACKAARKGISRLARDLFVRRDPVLRIGHPGIIVFVESPSIMKAGLVPLPMLQIIL